jgi:hypothetical protein
MNTEIEYLKIRQRRIDRIIGGLLNSKRKCGDSGTWTKKDEKEIIHLKGRQEEIQRTLAIINPNGKERGHKPIQHFIDKETQDFERMRKRNKE